MAENPEPHHVPQQNRKSKLRYIPTTSASSAAATTTTTNDQPPPSPLQTTTLLPSLFQLNPPSSISLPQPFHHFPLNLNLNQNDTVSTVPGGFLSHDLRSSVPLGPFTGYASILMRSRFLKPTEQILGDWCGVYGKDASDFHGDHGFCEIGVRDFLAFSDRIERSWKNSKLVVMLEEVYGKYKVYRQQMETVVSSFETVAGLGNAAPFVSCAFKSVAKHFVCLKNAILDQLHLSSSSSSSAASINDGRNVCRSNNNNSNIRVWNNNDEHGGVISSNNRQINHGRINIQQNAIWRSQRGLPDYAVSVLKTWLFDNFLHPYPSDSEKQMLAQQTGLSRNQVSNWFINARVRLWKPMVEEIHTLETRQAAQTPPEVVAENRDINKHSDQHQPRKIPQGNEEPQHLPTKRPCRIKSSHLSNSTYNQGDDHRGHHPHHQVQQNASYNNLSTNQQLTAVNVPVTLALGLHHNIGISQHYRQP